MFADNDDTLPQDAVKALVSAMEEGGSQLAVGAYTRNKEDLTLYRDCLRGYDCLSLSEYMIAQAGSVGRFDYYFLCVWNKIFQADIIREHGIAFESRAILNDYVFLLDYMEHVRSF